MAVRGYDPYEEARLRAIWEEVTGQKQVPKYKDYNPTSPADYGDDLEDVEELDDGTLDDASPVPLTDIPTSSTNVGKPRTVAAGFKLYVGAKKMAQPLGKMTVMFRDGTLYNYYDVTPGEWQNFSASISKGNPWLNKKNTRQAADGIFVGKRRGPADVANISDTVRQNIYRIARSAQVRYSSSRSMTINLSGETRTIKSGTVPKVAKTKAQLSPRSATSKRLGQNPSKGGKNPYKP